MIRRVQDESATEQVSSPPYPSRGIKQTLLGIRRRDDTLSGDYSMAPYWTQVTASSTSLRQRGIIKSDVRVHACKRKYEIAVHNVLIGCYCLMRWERCLKFQCVWLHIPFLPLSFSFLPDHHILSPGGRSSGHPLYICLLLILRRVT